MSDLAHLRQLISSHRDGAVSPDDVVMRELANNDSLNVTPELLYSVVENCRLQRDGVHILPKSLAEFIARLAVSRNPQSILDPTCGTGLLLKTVAELPDDVTTIHGVEINATAAQIAKRLLGEKANVIQGNTLDPSLSLLSKYDLIVAQPPFNLRMESPVVLEGYKEPIRGQFHDILACWAGQRLSENGMAILVMPEGFAFVHNSEQCKAALESQGVSITAYFHIQGGDLGYIGIDGYIVLLERKPKEDLFVAQYTADTEHQKTIIENLFARKQQGFAAQGRIIAHEDFLGYPSIEAHERLRRVLRHNRLPAVPMRRLVLESRALMPHQDFANLSEWDNSFYLSRIKQKESVFQRNQISGGHQHYYELAIDPTVADAHYVARMFNQPVGQCVLNTIRRGSRPGNFRLQDLMEVDFYLPPLEEQQKILAVQGKINSFRREIEERENLLWSSVASVDEVAHQVETLNQEDSFEDWLETLPFPLASILWRHRTFTGSPREKYEILLHFFEGLAEFLATIHLSAFSSSPEVWGQYKEELHRVLSKGNQSFERATFGTWKSVLEFLGARCRKMLAAEKEFETCCQLYCTQNANVLSMLCDPTVFACVSKANSLRNSHAHGGVVSDSQAREIHDKLESLVQDCRDVFRRSWNQYELLKPGTCSYRDGVFEHSVRSITGTRTPFVTNKRECIVALEDGALYLFDPDGTRGLKLLPFVRVMPSPQSENNACYFYSRQQDKESRYISYHFENEADYQAEFPETLQALGKLQFNLSEEKE